MGSHHSSFQFKIFSIYFYDHLDISITNVTRIKTAESFKMSESFDNQDDWDLF